MSGGSNGGFDEEGYLCDAYFECECGLTYSWPVTPGLAANDDPLQVDMLRIVAEHKSECSFHASAPAAGTSTDQQAADHVSEVAAVPQTQAHADATKVLDAPLSPNDASSTVQRLTPRHLLCHTCKKALIERDPTLLAEFEARHQHEGEEVTSTPRFFIKQNNTRPAPASPATVAARALAEKQLAAFNDFSSVAHRFDRDLVVIRAMDRSGQLDAGLVHLEAAWAEMVRGYGEMHGLLSRFVATEYYTADGQDEVPAKEKAAS